LSPHLFETDVAQIAYVSMTNVHFTDDEGIATEPAPAPIPVSSGPLV